jgi:hypothetical protein
MGCLIGMAGCIQMSVEAFGEPNVAQSRLSLHLVNAAEISDEVIAATKAHVERIFNHAGVPIGWDEASSLQLTIVLVKADSYQLAMPDRSVTGFAVSNNGQGARRAYVFIDRVKQQVQDLFVSAKNCREYTPETMAAFDRKRTEALILGHVIAHEVGHLMLPHGAHSATGIMSPQIDAGNFAKALDAKLLFSSGQSQLIRQVLLSAHRL